MKKWYSILASIAAGAGVCYFLVHQNILIFAPYGATYTPVQHDIAASKKRSNLFFYKEQVWCQETVDLVWPHKQSEALSYISNRWLTLAFEEEFIPKKITVTHAFISADGKGYISFDQSPFETHQAIHEKAYLIQGLVRSIQATGIPLTGLYFLVHNKQLQDYHLDFSTAWSLEPYPVTR